jgi:adenylate cyclase
MPVFIRVVLEIIRTSINAMPATPLAVNTWGDGLFVVAGRAAATIDLADRLLTAAETVNWKAEGLDDRITFRIGLHAGPCFVTRADPVIGRGNATGRNVSLAARIEPLATLGEAWASHAFVVLAAATGSDASRFRELGPRQLPKNAGEMRLYMMDRCKAV